MDKKDKIIGMEIFHFLCKIHFWQTQEVDLLFPPPLGKKKLKSCNKTNHFVIY